MLKKKKWDYKYCRKAQLKPEKGESRRQKDKGNK
jgi:hypothetical protein